MSDQIATLESILFTAGDPVSIDLLATVCAVSPEQIQMRITELANRCAQSDRPFQIYQQGSHVQLVTKPEYSDIMRSYWEAQRAEPLTRAQLETLSTIAYMGPISKSDIDAVRGVQSIITVRALSMRGLVTESDENGSTVYTLSSDALRHLGVTSVHELPQYDSVHSELVGLATTQGTKDH